jgi:hypothetical protein
MSAKTCQEVLDGDKQNLTGVSGNIIPVNQATTSDSGMSINERVDEVLDGVDSA